MNTNDYNNNMTSSEINSSKENINKQDGSMNIRNASNNNSPSKEETTDKITLYFGLFLVFAPFFITGFSFNWIWYVLIVIIGYYCYTLYTLSDSRKEKDSRLKKNILMGFCVAGFTMFLWGPLNPEYGTSSSSASNESYNYGNGQLQQKTLYCRKCHGKFYGDGTVDLCQNCRLRKQAHQDVMKDREEFGW